VQVSFDIVEVARGVQRGQHGQGPRPAQKALIILGGDPLHFMCQCGGFDANRGQAKFGTQGVTVAGVPLDQPMLDEMIHALREGASAGARGREQRRLPSRDAQMQARQNGQGPRFGSDVDKGGYVHKV
jgi:hypothetical protein